MFRVVGIKWPVFNVSINAGRPATPPNPALPRVMKMKLGTVIFAALAVMTFDRVAAAQNVNQRLLVKVADQVNVSVPLRPRRRHQIVAVPYIGPPVACEAVLFPRSPLCAGRPAPYGWYAPFPWNTYVSH